MGLTIGTTTGLCITDDAGEIELPLIPLLEPGNLRVAVSIFAFIY